MRDAPRYESDPRDSRHKRGSVLEKCEAGRGFSEVLAGLSSIRVRRTLAASEAQRVWSAAPKELAQLRLIDSMTPPEPTEYQVLPLGGPQHLVFLRDAATVYEAAGQVCRGDGRHARASTS